MASLAVSLSYFWNVFLSTFPSSLLVRLAQRANHMKEWSPDKSSSEKQSGSKAEFNGCIHFSKRYSPFLAILD